VGVWLMALAGTLVCAGFAASAIGFVMPVLGGLVAVLLVAFAMAVGYLRGPMSGKKIELISALWTLALYLLLGLVPLYFK
jgi:hypothetical protein